MTLCGAAGAEPSLSSGHVVTDIGRRVTNLATCYCLAGFLTLPAIWATGINTRPLDLHVRPSMQPLGVTQSR